MTNFETVLLTILGLAMFAAWYVAVFKLKPEVHDRTDQFRIGEWEEIDSKELGEIEATLDGLVKVVVAAHGVEEPQDSLRVAVKRNLTRRVEYQFLVSKSRGAFERTGWVKMFVAIAEVVLAKDGAQIKARDLIHISSLAHDWRDMPYVFYFTVTHDNRGAIIAFRGNQVDEGIAEKYTRLPGPLAYTIANALMSDAPVPMEIVEEPFLIEPEISSKIEDRDESNGDTNASGT